MHRDRPVPGVGADLEHAAIDEDAGAANHRVQPPEALEGGRDDLLTTLHRRHIGSARGGLAACGDDLVRHHLGYIRLGASGAVDRPAVVGNDDACAFLGEPQRDPAADAAARAGDGGDLALEWLRHGRHTRGAWGGPRIHPSIDAFTHCSYARFVEIRFRTRRLQPGLRAAQPRGTGVGPGHGAAVRRSCASTPAHRACRAPVRDPSAGLPPADGRPERATLASADGANADDRDGRGRTDCHRRGGGGLP